MAYSVVMQGIKNRYIGIDTSCYTTSIAIVENRQLIFDLRRPIRVPVGLTGLRQSDILFQHMQNLTIMMESIKDSFLLDSIKAVGCSGSPRNEAGSYMPVFLAGQLTATTISSSLGCPLHLFSHQAGHLAAVQLGKPLAHDFLAFHLSGGTTEIVRAKRVQTAGYSTEIIGGTLDISFGQLIDRIGVYTGLAFPPGAQMDRLASESNLNKDRLSLSVKVNGGWFNLSGLENKIKSIFDQKSLPPEDLYKSLFLGLTDLLIRLIEEYSHTGETVILAGGVSANAIMRQRIENHPFKRNIQVCFGSPELSTDNGVGIALLTEASLSRED